MVMASSPSSTESMPKLMFTTTGIPYFSSKEAAYSKAFFMLLVRVAPPDNRLSPSFMEMTQAPGAAPCMPSCPLTSKPAAMPAQCEPWAPSSKWNSTVGGSAPPR